MLGSRLPALVEVTLTPGTAGVEDFVFALAYYYRDRLLEILKNKKNNQPKNLDK